MPPPSPRLMFAETTGNIPVDLKWVFSFPKYVSKGCSLWISDFICYPAFFFKGMGWKRPYILHENPNGCKVLFPSPGHALISLSLKISLSHSSPLSAPLHFGKKDDLLPWHNSRGCLSQKSLTQKCFHSCNMICTHTGCTQVCWISGQFSFFSFKRDFLVSKLHGIFFSTLFLVTSLGGAQKGKNKETFTIYTNTPRLLLIRSNLEWQISIL